MSALCTPSIAAFPTRYDAATDPEGFLLCHRLALAELPPGRLETLFDTARGNLRRALTDIDVQLAAGCTVKQRQRLADAARSGSGAVDAGGRAGVIALWRHDPAFPPALAALAPLGASCLLFVRGDLSALAPGFAIVGTRRPSPYGVAQARRFADAFARAGEIVISGGAAGIDTASHDAALCAGGRTVSVIACGPDIVYPATNTALARRILESGGAIVTEYGVGARPEPWRFPARNRIIAGMANATLLIEAPEQSGALITARHALEFGRDIHVVPGPVDSGRFRGSHALISDGAFLAQDPEDLLGNGLQRILPLDRVDRAPITRNPAPTAVIVPAVPIRTAQPPTLPPGSAGDDARTLWNTLTVEWEPLDDVAERAGLSPARCAAALTLLEMARVASRQPDGVRRIA